MEDFISVNEKADFRVLSLGAGIQSSTLALMCNEGIIRKPNCAIFADTGAEPQSVYKHLSWLESVLNFPLYRVSAGNLETDLIQASKSKRFASIPFYTTSISGGGMMRRQCTREYKIAPIEKKIRELLGLKPRQRMKHTVLLYVGISLDEMIRVKRNRNQHIKNKYPLLGLRMNRYDCIQWLKDKGYDIPPKSACYFCPYTDDARWREMKINDPESFKKAIEIDELIRKKDFNKVKEKLYLHSSLKPLSEVDFSNAEDHGQMNLFRNECEGMCGV